MSATSGRRWPALAATIYGTVIRTAKGTLDDAAAAAAAHLHPLPTTATAGRGAHRGA